MDPSIGYSKIRTKVNALDERIKEVIWEFEDLLESHYADQILPQLESERDRLPFLVDMQSLRQSVDCFIKRVKAMEVEYDNEPLNMREEEGEPLSSRIDFGGINSHMVGLSDQFEQLRDYLLAKGEGEGHKTDGKGKEDDDDGDEYEAEKNSVSVIGMAGVGKTTLAKKVFDDPSIQRHFKLRAWVRVGRKCESTETLWCILAQVDPSTHHQMLTQRDNDGKLHGLLKERVKDKKCLIVLDDVWEWDTRLMDSLRKKNVQILLTSRLRIEDSPIIHVVRLLNNEESEELLSKQVFGEKGFPAYLEEFGKKIAEKCEGLPLMIVTVAELLSKANKGVGTKSCTVEILKRIPNLMFLSIVSVRKPYDEDDDSNSLSGLANISEELQNLISLTYEVVYSDMKWKSMVPLSMFPSSLLVLSLSGLGYPWKYMNEIGSMLPNLSHLILKDYAFRGPKWV
ncbi:putative disease resistance RPP13-like protein 2 [Salvia hispanica]|uniref:putative disease resistance RPP13-like protein 2 n=1 Tax=Salvia hispanica TaxID=49212 RepID=UPI0020097364|nr:putative disease resistance RPP13-like protein 2 [Salvia hispanica]